jgi:hypothetical protein
VKPPIPTTRSVILPSAGYDYMRATEHVYVETRAVTLDCPDGDAWEFIFKCRLTGELRRFGIENRREVIN